MNNPIAHEIVYQAMLDVDRLSLREREALGDEIYQHQPHMLASVLVLQQVGASLEQMGVVLNILFIVYLAMKRSGHAWPQISEDLQDRCMKRLVGKAEFIEGLSHPTLVERAVEAQILTHAEPGLLAIACKQLRDHGLQAARSEVEHYATLNALNLVECVAAARRTHTTKAVRRRAAQRATTTR